MAKPEEEQPAGAPEWMVTFSDIVTLLVTFFVLMLTFSSMDEEVFNMFADSVAGIGLEGVIPPSASKKGLSKKTPCTSMPCSRRTHTASWLSSPPDRSASARIRSVAYEFMRRLADSNNAVVSRQQKCCFQRTTP